jgi:hypothetical protein
MVPLLSSSSAPTLLNLCPLQVETLTAKDGDYSTDMMVGTEVKQAAAATAAASASIPALCCTDVATRAESNQHLLSKRRRSCQLMHTQVLPLPPAPPHTMHT